MGTTITIILLSLLLGGSIFVNLKFWNAIGQRDKYKEELEGYLIELKIHFVQAYKAMQRVDVAGAFEADDEVGQIYKEIKKSVLKLNDVVPDVNLSENGQKEEE